MKSTYCALTLLAASAFSGFASQNTTPQPPITVPPGAAADGSGLSAECFISGVSGVETILGTDAEIDVYDINGALLKRGCTREELKQLTPAVYILRSGDTVVKTVIR